MNDKIINFIEYAIKNGSDKNLELEARFGKYTKITSNIKPTTFFNVYNLFKSGKKSYSFIRDELFDNIRKRTEMTCLNTNKLNLTKDLFDNHHKILTPDIKINPGTNVNSEYKNMVEKYVETYINLDDMHDKNSFYIKKDKIYKPIRLENMTIDLVMEVVNNSKSRTSKSLIPTYYKNKFRCSIKCDAWDIDLTILLILDYKTKKTGLYFEIETEFNYESFYKKKLNVSHAIDEFNKNSNAILSIVECAKQSSLDVELRYSMFNQVVTLEKIHLQTLTNGNYSVTEKADGDRVFIYIDDKKNVYCINPSNAIVDKISLIKLAKTLSISNTLIDCEMITIKGNSVFMGFDLLYFDGNNYRNYNLETRLRYLKITIDELNKLKKYAFKIKTFYTNDIFINASNIWNKRLKLFPYNLDGLIFTPVRGSYQSNLPNYKWKHRHSIDVRIFYNSNFDFTEFHPNAMPYIKKGNSDALNSHIDNKTNKIYYKQRINVSNIDIKSLTEYKRLNLVNARGDLGIPGKLNGCENLQNMVDIIEIEYDRDVNKWIFLRKRPDKSKPNAYKTIISVLNAIYDNITIDKLSKLIHKKSTYESINSNVICNTNIGFNFIASSIDSNLCDFYTYAHCNILSKVSKINSTILVLGCDLCLLKALSKTYKNILIIESNCLEVYGQYISEGYSGLLEQSQNLGITASIIWGDTDISNGIKAFTKSGQTQINTYIKNNNIISYNSGSRRTAGSDKKFDCIFISSFVNILYNNNKSIFDKKMYDKNIITLKTLTSNILCIFLNGSRVIKHLTSDNCIIIKNKKLHPLYKIYIDNTNLDKFRNLDLFKISDVKMLEIQRMETSFVSQKYPLIFNENVQSLIKESFICMKECNSFKKLYLEYKKNNNNLTEYDYIISDITNYFVLNIP
jgi:hypothetical protein